MQHGYNVLREADRQHMLDTTGASSLDDLLSFIPQQIRLKERLRLPEAMSEWALRSHLQELASRNETADTHSCFLGGGVYDHYIPEVVNTIANRRIHHCLHPLPAGNQPGLLRCLYDFQQIIGNLFEMPYVNCSVYDGATALAECAWMAISFKQNKRIIISESIWPQYRKVLDLYMANRDVEIVTIPSWKIAAKWTLHCWRRRCNNPQLQ